MLPHSIAPVETRLCACGCGQEVRTRFNKNKEPVFFRPGHHRVKDGHVVRSSPRTCAYCGAEIAIVKSRGRRYCSRDCYWKARGCLTEAPKGGWADSIDRGIFKVAASPRIQRLHVLARKSACDQCGWNKIPQVLELHHKNENKRDGRWENLELLCPTCHQVHHYLSKSGMYDVTRYARAKKLREALGLPVLPTGIARTSLQRLVDKGKINVQ